MTHHNNSFALSAQARLGAWLAHHRRWLAVAGTGCVGLALFASGLVTGWHLADRAAAARLLPEPPVVTVPAPDGASAGVMPDVRGLDEASAWQVIVDAGISPGVIVTATKPWAGQAGLVIEQTPVFGTAAPAQVSLTVSAGAKVPAPDGRAGAEVAAEIAALGAQVVVVHRYQPGAAAGTVLAIEPAPGEPLPAQVTITQADSPLSLYLRDVAPLQGDCTAAAVEIGGAAYDHSLVCPAPGGGDAVWLLSQLVDSVTGEAGVPDSAVPAGKARVQIIVDDDIVFDQVVEYGKPAVPFDVPVTGANRLTVKIVNLAGAGVAAQAGLGDVRLAGGAEAIKALGGK